MSALQRARRSTSKTAPESGRDSTLLVDLNANSIAAPPIASSALSSPTPASPLEVSASDIDTDTVGGLAMPKRAFIPVSSTPNIPAVAPPDDSKEGYDDAVDNRSSSLSELGDAYDDHSEPTPRDSIAAELIDEDSEAETERLEQTPRKLKRTATDTSLASEALYERTPSKLMYSRTIDQGESAPSSPTALVEDTMALRVADGDAALHTLSIIATSESASLAEITGKKRKRSSEDDMSVNDVTVGPARKRGGTVKTTSLNGGQEGGIEQAERLEVEDELDNAEERLSQLTQEELELEDRQANVAAEVVSELATVAKLTKPRKGGRRGKRKMEDVADTNSEITAIEAQEGDGEAENEDDDSGAHDEEAAKKKVAIDELAKIEKKFKIFREKLCDEQIAQCEQQLEMLKQPNCTHPEYLAMVQCIDDRRAEKIAYEKTLLRYKQKCLEIRTVAERHQLHSQFFQTVRDIREQILSECHQHLYELQRGRRQHGVEDVEYSMRLPEKRSEQIRQQTAYNLEVSVLSGVAKYVGFPAAPEIKSARHAEIEDDLRAMKIVSRPAPVPYVRPYNRTSTADEAAAEEQFIERTPWANPQHPAHQQLHYQGTGTGPSRIASQAFQTPAAQRRIADIHAPNGSASTIDMNSNPPSSAAGQGLYPNGPLSESESPVLQMKRVPGDIQSQVEIPGSFHRTLTGLRREPYASGPQVLSSPAAGEQLLEEPGAARWSGNGVRPVGTSSVPAPGSHVPGRPEAGRLPLAQRGGLGPVSVGSAGGLFGR